MNSEVLRTEVLLGIFCRSIMLANNRVNLHEKCGAAMAQPSLECRPTLGPPERGGGT